MNNNLGDILNQKHDAMRQQQSLQQRLQAIFDARYGEKTCQVQLKDEILIAKVTSGMVANQLRLQQVAVMAEVRVAARPGRVAKLRILIA